MAWISGTSNWLLQMDLETGKPIGTFRLRHPVGPVATATDSVWIAENEIAMKVPENLSTQEVRFIQHLPHQVDRGGAVFAAGAVWAGGCAAPNFACLDKVARIDPGNGTIIRFKSLGGGLAAFGDTLWAQKANGVVRIDASKNVVAASIPLPLSLNSHIKLMADSRALWIVDEKAIWHVDAQTNQATKIDFQSPIQGCLTGNTLWVLEFAQELTADKASTLNLLLHRFDAQTQKEIGTAVGFGENRSASQIQMQACEANQIWLSDKSGVLLKLDMKQ